MTVERTRLVLLDCTPGLRRLCNPVKQSCAFHCRFAHTRAFSLWYHPFLWIHLVIPISVRFISLTFVKSHDYLSADEVTLKDAGRSDWYQTTTNTTNHKPCTLLFKYDGDFLQCRKLTFEVYHIELQLCLLHHKVFRYWQENVEIL